MTDKPQPLKSRTNTNPLPNVIAGPILRQATEKSVTLWLITSQPVILNLALLNQDKQKIPTVTDDHHVKVGEYAYIHIITAASQQPLNNGERYFYDLFPEGHSGEGWLSSQLDDFLYPNETLPPFVYKKNVSNLLHGSCRKPHHNSEDGLLAVDALLEKSFTQAEEQPDLLIMSGDQVYIDDVAGPTLHAIHQVIDRLGLFDTTLPLHEITSREYLEQNRQSYYQRNRLLPDTEANATLIEQFVSGKKKPVFTSVNANNHLITFAEVIAMYILVWSPEMWALVDLEKDDLAEEFKPLYQKELEIIKKFVAGLGRVRRALAHVPVYMIFDDHDVTDDWNLTRGWEEAVYSNPFAKRIVGNALIGYWLCQGWGNNPVGLAPLNESLLLHFQDDGLKDHDQLIDTLLEYDQWHYSINTQPKIVVLDTRTQRWRSESNANKPSGLMDWEALCDLQQELIGQQSVIMVSPSPVFGVKLIEAVQKMFTFFGKPLVVDAENWMAHKGTASVMLNIFRHIKTPPNFVILSGDVHYSFVYDITLRFRKNTPRITQITSSGIKNEFPDTLLKVFDRLNRFLYHSRSPLNWLTQRRYMNIKHRKPGEHRLTTLLNASSIGKVRVSENCEEVEASVIRSNGEEIEFHQR